MRERNFIRDHKIDDNYNMSEILQIVCEIFNTYKFKIKWYRFRCNNAVQSMGHGNPGGIKN